MKKNFILFFIFVISFTNIAFAHPGGTDGSGGHYNRTTGEYHYHHGFPAHQHENGICPYDFEDQSFYDNLTTNYQVETNLPMDPEEPYINSKNTENDTPSNIESIKEKPNRKNNDILMNVFLI